MNNIEICLVVAMVLFVIAGFLRLFVRTMDRPFDGALVAFGLALFALAFLVNP